MKNLSMVQKREFVQQIDHYVYKAIANSKKKYERNEGKAKSQLILNQVGEDGEEIINNLIGTDDIECNWGFLDTIENEELYFALSKLSPKELKLVKLKFFYNCSNDEINTIMGFKHKKSCINCFRLIIQKLRESMISKEE